MIEFMDGKEITVPKVDESYVREGVLQCWAHLPGEHRHLGAFPTSNIRKYVNLEWQ